MTILHIIEGIEKENCSEVNTTNFVKQKFKQILKNFLDKLGITISCEEDYNLYLK